jgi:Domain of unknown function (DUF4407)
MLDLIPQPLSRNPPKSTTPITLAIRSLGGGDNSILSTLDFAEEDKKFTVLGLLVLVAGFSAAYGMFLFLGDTLSSYFSVGLTGITGFPLVAEQLLLGIAWGLSIILIDRTIILSLRSQKQNTKANAFFWIRIILSLFIAIIVSEPIKLKIYEKDISNQFKNNQLKALKATVQSQTLLQNEINIMLDACATVRQGVDVRSTLVKLTAIEDCAKKAFEAESVGSKKATENGARSIICDANGEVMPIKGQSCNSTPACVDGDFYQIFSNNDKKEYVEKSTGWVACEKKVYAKTTYINSCSSSYGYLKKWSINQKERIEYAISDEYRHYRKCSHRIGRYQELQEEVDNLNQNTFANKLALLTDVALNGFWNTMSFIGLTFLLWMLELGAVFAKFVLPTPLHDKLLSELGEAKSITYSSVIARIKNETVLMSLVLSNTVRDVIAANTTAIQLKESGLRLCTTTRKPLLSKSVLILKVSACGLICFFIYRIHADLNVLSTGLQLPISEVFSFYVKRF